MKMYILKKNNYLWQKNHVTCWLLTLEQCVILVLLLVILWSLFIIILKQIGYYKQCFCEVLSLVVSVIPHEELLFAWRLPDSPEAGRWCHAVLRHRSPKKRVMFLSHCFLFFTWLVPCDASSLTALNSIFLSYEVVSMATVVMLSFFLFFFFFHCDRFYND
jgi:hypothetical protein